MSLISICSVAVIVVMLLCFGLGFLRGWKKSLIRFSIVLGCFLLSLFVGPAIASLLMKKFVNGFVLSVFSVRIDFEDAAGKIIDDKQFVEEVFSANSTTSDLTNAIMNVLLNMIVFIVMFIALFLLSLLIYGIVSLATGRKTEKTQEENRGKYWGLKSLGGFIGLVGGIVSLIAICLVP